MFVSQWGSAQLSDDTPPCSVRIFLTQMRLTSQTCRRRFHTSPGVEQQMSAHFLAVCRGNEKVILLGSFSRGGPELTATSRALAAARLSVDC